MRALDLPPDSGPRSGPLAWMVHNRITPNLLMLALIIGGLLVTTRIKQEVFPEFELDRVTVAVAYPGASPEEVERGIVLAVEEAVRSIEGVKEVNATAGEGSARVGVELREDADAQRVFQDIEREVNRITTLPDDAEEPVVTLAVRRREVLSIQLFGDVPEPVLRELVEEVRDRLLQEPGVTQVDLEGARDPEVTVAVPSASLRAHGLTLDALAKRIGALAVEVPGGGIDTPGGEVLLRVKERRDRAREFGELPVVTAASGAVLRLRDIATVGEGFEDTDTVATYNGKRAMALSVFRVGGETPMGVSAAVRTAMTEIGAALPPAVNYAIERDRSEVYQQRLELLLKNAFIGLVLVLVLLGLFLEPRVAFWVTMGIPTAFLGAMLFLPGMAVSINMISMFAFIIALGIVVDDAIVAGENIYEYRSQGMGAVEAAIRGARDVAVPVSFSILSNILAFLPLAFVPGTMGKIWGVIPLVVTAVFLISWVEAILVLPGHLAHVRKRAQGPLIAALDRPRRAFAGLFERFVHRVYGPFLRLCLRLRYLTVAAGIALLAVVVAYALSGRMGLVLMPKVESDRAVASAVLPFGSPLAAAEQVRDRMESAARALVAEHGGERLASGVAGLIRDNRVEITVFLTAPEVRPLSTARFAALWRERVGGLPGLQSLRFESDRGGPGGGPGLTVELSHRDVATLDRAGEALAAALEQFGPVKDVDDGYTPGKPQLDFSLKPEGQALGLTAAELGRQLRFAFHGAEALKQQRGRNEVTVRVRLPESERLSEHDIERFLVRTPAGRDVPLAQVAEVARGRAYASITRRDGRRTIQVTAEVTPADETGQIVAALEAEVLPQLARDFPGLAYGFEGRQADLRDSLRSLVLGFVAALVGIYVLLAVPLRSYVQPLIVMAAIPFGVVGAILGHLLMGYSLSVISLMGIVALAGVVVNDSLVMVHFANGRRDAGLPAAEAIGQAGVRRFRPILLTTLTTFGGLAPMIFETSRQARFMIPMALSLGYGILFATAITLVLVPCLYLIIEDLCRPFRAGAPSAATQPALVRHS